MWRDAGIERDATGLGRALAEAARWPDEPSAPTRDAMERRQMAILARLMLTAALTRDESRGAHYRSDFPARDDGCWQRHLVYRRGD
jgi:L-aspartate oxidase